MHVLFSETEWRFDMKIFNKFREWVYILILNLLKEESYEEDLRRNFSMKYTGLAKASRKYS